MDISRYEVGQPVMPPCSDSVIFDMGDGGATLIIAMHAPTEKEQHDFKSGAQQFHLAVANDIIFFLSRFGAGPWMDAPYYRHRSRPYTLSTPQDGEGFAMHAMLVDAASGILIAQKLIGLPHALSLKLIELIEKQPEIKNYDAVLSMTFQLYTTQQLLEIVQV